MFICPPLAQGDSMINLKEKIEYHSLMAKWWMTSASTKYCLSEEFFDGDLEIPISDKEKVALAMRKSKKHLECVNELIYLVDNSQMSPKHEVKGGCFSD